MGCAPRAWRLTCVLPRCVVPRRSSQQLFDSKYGPTWHCIVGADFRSYVTHESKHFIFFYHGKLAICLYKCG